MIAADVGLHTVMLIALIITGLMTGVGIAMLIERRINRRPHWRDVVAKPYVTKLKRDIPHEKEGK